jgi:hypothetical protein
MLTVLLLHNSDFHALTADRMWNLNTNVTYAFRVVSNWCLPLQGRWQCSNPSSTNAYSLVTTCTSAA